MNRTAFATVTQAEPAILKWVVARDDIDHDAILQAIERSNNLSNWQLGYLDAHDGAPFAPEAYFAATAKCVEYANGFITRRPDCEAARRFIAKRERPQPQLELFVVQRPAAPEECPSWLEDAMYCDAQMAAVLEEKDAKPGLDASHWPDDDYEEAGMYPGTTTYNAYGDPVRW